MLILIFHQDIGTQNIIPQKHFRLHQPTSQRFVWFLKLNKHTELSNLSFMKRIRRQNRKGKSLKLVKGQIGIKSFKF